ncbi:carboxymuconolactone decarboxylase family protein [Methermicoccus shengliensis]|uniref:Carboxymuconolactone decarboxylase family protein n=1 Tax=Methermicoccus shengliensis TaxID=660064 RepID=A0A832RX88_9EURY|nr:carboxymuconolactone decarboxylase family protein [Methermicoccus shengliensis]KUK05128.1 MAG: hypothetical protein XD46_0121 [Euryarchaeota archaeon 55_53]KUK30694.1 MAG: hypothetical protein XD62_0203 [Methanosarcinales archeaon 56_1174]MDI3487288.1 hypothetical protein [Methanosarcinales archaeon]MDN5294637.1 hypothetical protein [Methanosarcinales archaeon]HIH69344.1 carboxymuconolactone decarboxylase family protein [Methermicoccus shengliensis]
MEDPMERLASELPEVFEKFGKLHEAVFSDRSLSVKQKELIAVGIAVAIRCSPCLRHHVEEALKAGATKDEILEAVSVGLTMRGGPAMHYAAEAIEMLEGDHEH